MDIESQLESHILKFEELMFGITARDIRKLAFDIAEKHQIKHNFNRVTGFAGKKCYYKFMARHQNLTLRQPESTSIARAKGFNRENVFHFFDILERICDQNQLDATRVYNVDESGFSTVQKRCQKIVGRKGKKQIGAITSGERGVNTTMVCCISVSGHYVPPMIIFKRNRMSDELKIGAPAGSLVEISESGYINSDLFTEYLKHFIQTVNPSKDRKVLLLLDGHTTHNKNLEALELAREYGVILLQLPSHTTHRLQPLDVSFFKPLETYYTEAVQKWLMTHSGMKVTMFQVSQLLAEAYNRAANIQTAVNGLKATGVWSVDRNVFTDSDFMAADNLNLNIADNRENLDPVSNVAISSSSDDPILCSNVNLQRRETVKRNFSNIFGSTEAGPSTSFSHSLQELFPIPVPVPSSNVRLSKAAQKAAELTSTPYKDNLKLSKSKRSQSKTTEKGKSKKKNLKKDGSVKYVKKTKRKI